MYQRHLCTLQQAPIMPPKPVTTITVVHHRRALIAPGCSREEAHRAAPKRILGSGGVKTEKAYQDEKGSAE